MKPLLLSLLFLASHALSFSQGIVRIKGQITHPTGDSISVSYYQDWLAYTRLTVSAKPDRQGKFSLQIPIASPYERLSIDYGNETTDLVAADGADLLLTFDAARMDSTVRYSGKGSDMANFVARHVLERDLMNMSSHIRPYAGLDADSFILVAANKWQEELDFLQQYGADLPGSFRAYWKDYYTYSHYLARLNYPLHHHASQSFDFKVIPQRDFRHTETIPLAFDDTKIDLSPYRQYLTRIFTNRRLAATPDTDTSSRYSHAFYAADLTEAYRHMPPESASFMGAFSLYRDIGDNYVPLDTLEGDMQAYRQKFPGSPYLPALEDKLAFRRRTAPGQPAMDFTFTTTDNRTLRLSDLKGKVVLLHFWASWCQPCIRELPEANRIMARFKDKPVVFLQLSLDEQPESWKTAVTKYKMEGLHAWVPRHFESEVAKKYRIEGVPTYFLIDKKGRFAVADVPRPDDSGELIDALNRLL